MRYLLFFLYFIVSMQLATAQSYQKEYLEAKRQYNLENYKAARSGFESVMKIEGLAPYASFYYGLSSFKLGEYKLATDMWKQVLAKYPNWDKTQEIYYWLAYTFFDNKDYKQAFSYADKLAIDLRQELVDYFLNEASTDDLEFALASYPEKEVAIYLHKKLNNEPFDKKDHDLIAELVNTYGIKHTDGTDTKTIFKDKYAVAVVLPFMFEGLESPQAILNNKVIYDLFEGLQLATSVLDSLQIPVEIFPYDTKKSRADTRKIVKDSNLADADVIIGPLYTGPIDVLRAFSYDNEIPIINPLSSTSAVMDNNPFMFLFNPSNETKGTKAAEYASKKYANNKNVCIYYETLKDSLLAANYKHVLEDRDFKILAFEQINNESAQQIQIEFTAQDEIILKDSSSLAEVRSTPHRILHKRQRRDKTSGKILQDKNEQPLFEYYENRFRVAHDSVGHILAATSSNLLANNFISIAEVRNDSIGLIGYSDWLDFSLIDYNQVERIGASLISVNFSDISSSRLKEFNELSRRLLKKDPSKYHQIGYELMMHLGHLLNEYGTTISTGLRSSSPLEGYLMQGLKYGSFNDNQIVPILQLKDLTLINKTSIFSNN